MQDELGPWIDGTVPPPVGAYVQMEITDLKGRGDAVHEAIVLAVDGADVYLSPELALARQWEIDRYRIRRPRALLELIDMVEGLTVDA